MPMRNRKFVWTWWAGYVSDHFGPKSVFRRASIGALRIRGRRAGVSGGEARRGRPSDAGDGVGLVYVPYLSMIDGDLGGEL